MSSANDLRRQIAGKNSPPPSAAEKSAAETAATSSADDATECFNSGDNPLGLLVRGGDDLFAFPYAHFLFARTVDKRGVAIRFATHNVLLIGEGLETIVQDLAEHRLTMLRTIPERYQKARKSAVWIERIEVTELAEEQAPT